MAFHKQKHENLLKESIGEKSVDELPGVGEITGNILRKEGYDKVYVILGQFLVLKKNQEDFQDWLKDICGGMKTSDCVLCYNCLKEWCDTFL